MPILFQLIVALIVIGVVLYLVENVVPIDPGIKVIIRAVVLLVVLFWVLSLFLPMGSFGILRR